MLDGLEVEPVILEGEPAPMIAQAVHDFDIDLVTIVTHGRKGLSRALGDRPPKRSSPKRPVLS